MSSGSTTSVKGQGPADICKRYGAYLCARIYEEPTPPEEPNSRFPDEIKKAKKLWKKVLELNEQEASGAFGQFYRPIGADQNDGGKSCWPILTFRGTDFEDFRGLGISVSIDSEKLHEEIEEVNPWRHPIDAANSYVKEKYQNLLKDVSTSAQEGIGAALDKVDEVTKSQAEGGVKAVTNKSRGKNASWINLGWIHNHPEVRTAAQAESMPGYKVEQIFHQKGRVGVSSLSDVFTIDMKLVYKENEHGDWLNNLLQGMGKIGPIYSAALEFAEICYKNEVKPSDDSRMMVNGHSLGGGLASACNMSLQYYHEKEGLNVYSVVFNPAGVHEETIRPAPLTGATIEICKVPDEILTSLANYPTKIPFIGQILRLSKYPDGLPKPLGSYVPYPGRSPGKADESWNVPPKWSKVPRLFPVTEQTVSLEMKKHNFKYLMAIDKGLSYIEPYNSSSNEPTEFNPLFESALKELWDGYEAQTSYINRALRSASGSGFIVVGGEVIDVIDFFGELKTQINAEISDLLTLFSMSASYHGMDYALATYEANFLGYNATVAQPNLNYGMPANVPSADQFWQNLGNLRW